MAGSTSNFAGVHLHVPRTVKLECDDKMIAVAALGLAAAFLFALLFLREHKEAAALLLKLGAIDEAETRPVSQSSRTE